MLALFRNNKATGGLMLVFYAALLRLSWLRDLPTLGRGTEAGFFSEEILRGLASQNLIWSALLAFFLTFVLAFLSNQLANDFRVSSETTWFAGLFCLLAASAVPDFLKLSAPLIASIFSVLAFRNLFGTFNAKSDGPLRLFNIGFYLGIAGLCYPPVFLLFSPILLGLASLRGFNLRERMMTFLGLLTSLLLVWTGYFWFDAGGWFWEKHFWLPFGWLSFDTILTQPALIFRLILPSLMLFIVAILAGGLYQKKLVQQQKYISILFWWLIGAIGSCLFLNEFRLEHFVIAVPPLGILLGSAFINLKNKTIAEVLHIVMLFAAIALNFLI